MATIRLGRRIYDNLRKAIEFIVAVHITIAGLALLPLLLGGIRGGARGRRRHAQATAPAGQPIAGAAANPVGGASGRDCVSVARGRFSGGAAVLIVVAAYCGPAQLLFRFSHLHWTAVGVCLGAAVLNLLLLEMLKAYWFRDSRQAV